MARKAIPSDVKLLVLTEAGYRCAVPTCRNILAIDMHHIEEVAEGGGNDVANLIALCPTCHALYHRGTIQRQSIAIWKNMLIVFSNAFDSSTIDQLLFLEQSSEKRLNLSGDGIAQFYRLIASGLADFTMAGQPSMIVKYRLQLTKKGQRLLHAWKNADKHEFSQIFGAPAQ